MARRHAGFERLIYERRALLRLFRGICFAGGGQRKMPEIRGLRVIEKGMPSADLKQNGQHEHPETEGPPQHG